MRLPHRPPYLWLTGPTTARAPEHPAQLVEVCAQAAAVALADSHHPDDAVGPRDGVLVGVSGFEVRGEFHPGEALRVQVERKAIIGDQTLVRCAIATADGRTVAEGRLALRVVDR